MSRLRGGAARRRGAGEEERDAQGLKLREIAERVWNGAADRVDSQLPANSFVRVEGVQRGESAVSEWRA